MVELATFLTELATVGVAVPGIIVAGISAISSALVGSAVVIFAVGTALVMRGFRLIPRTIRALRG